jgi:surfactin synthase thioesterase subunit
MLTWRNQTSGAFTLNLLPGDHFFLQRQRAELLESISGALALDLAQTD